MKFVSKFALVQVFAGIALGILVGTYIPSSEFLRGQAVVNDLCEIDADAVGDCPDVAWFRTGTVPNVRCYKPSDAKCILDGQNGVCKSGTCMIQPC
jgi:hypothetical protein